MSSSAAGHARLVSARDAEGKATPPAASAQKEVTTLSPQYLTPIGPQPSAKASDQSWIIRTMFRTRSMILGTPPKRVLDDQPSLHLFGVHRWVYFWLYVALRLYRVKSLHWLPAPRPTPAERSKRAMVLIDKAQFNELKSFSSISLKGGVGKTSILKAFIARMKALRSDLDILIQDNNPDRGTLADRGDRTTRFSVKDLLKNLNDVKLSPDFKRYCNRMAEGYFLLASSRPKQYSSHTKVTADEFNEIREKQKIYFDLSAYDCGTDSSNESNQAALKASDVILLVTTAAKDSIEQTIVTYVWICQDAELSKKHVILVINRKHWWVNLDKIQETVISETKEGLNEEGEEKPLTSLETRGIGWDLRLQLGLNFNSSQLQRSVRADIDQLIAAAFDRTADSFAGDFDTQLTHAEMTTQATLPTGDVETE